jgi:tRNA threonylcarbamoyladenosine biosynthesis protein TsaB
VKVLGLDTSGYVNAVGVTDSDRVLADFAQEARNDSLERIVANIDETIKQAGLTLNDIEGIGVGLGPGSWTGIRVGVTVGKTLAFSTGRPVAGVPTLRALAYGVRAQAPLVCAVIPAGTGDTVYAAFYRTAGGTVDLEGDYYVGGIEELKEKVPEGAVVVVGESVYGRNVPGKLGSLGVRIVTAAPGGAAVATLAAARLEKGESDDALSLEPLYLKESTAKAFTNRYARRME